MRIFLASASLFLLAQSAAARTVHVTDLSPAELDGVLAGDADVTVEFRAGDLLPLELKAEGDLLATEGNGTATLKVQQTFYLRSDGQEVALSTDGRTFRPVKEAVTGRLSANAGGGDNGRITHLTLALAAWLKP